MLKMEKRKSLFDVSKTGIFSKDTEVLYTNIFYRVGDVSLNADATNISTCGASFCTVLSFYPRRVPDSLILG